MKKEMRILVLPLAMVPNQTAEALQVGSSPVYSRRLEKALRGRGTIP